MQRYVFLVEAKCCDRIKKVKIETKEDDSHASIGSCRLQYVERPFISNHSFCVVFHGFFCISLVDMEKKVYLCIIIAR